MTKKIKKDKTEEILNPELETLKSQLAEMTELGKRAMADMQNLKRRQQEERSQTIIRANASLIQALIPTVEILHKALEHKPQEAQEWVQGIEMSIKQIDQALLDAGLEKIETKDQKFDPNIHEALLQGPGEKDIILEELEAGYKLGDFIIRHSKVKVGNGE